MQYKDLLEKVNTGQPLIRAFPEAERYIDLLDPRAADIARSLLFEPTANGFDAADILEVHIYLMLLTPQRCLPCGGKHVPAECWPVYELAPETKVTGTCPTTGDAIVVELVYGRYVPADGINVVSYQLAPPAVPTNAPGVIQAANRDATRRLREPTHIEGG